MLFKVGNTNFTSYVQESTYKIDQTDHYKTWTDGKYNERRKYYARGVFKGSFEMVFTTSSQLTAFANAITNNTSSASQTAGRVNVTLQASSTNVTRTTNVFLAVKTKKRVKINNTTEYIRVSVEVTE